MTTPETTLRADVDGRFYLRFLLIGVAAIGFALWSLYDGVIKYPNQRERALAYLKLVEEDRQTEWKEVAREQGWPTRRPGKLRTSADIMFQYMMASVAGTVGLGFLVVVLRAHGRWIEATPSGIRTSWGQQCDFDRVLTLNKKRWREKGIAKITYQEGNRKRRLILDNYKYDRYVTNEILHDLESRIGEEKIVGGPPEPPYEEQPEETATSGSGESGSSE